MTDYEFKTANHICKGYKVISKGEQIESKYSPDIVLCNGNKYVILEHESQPNRKTIVADLIKAAHFLRGNKTGILVIVMSPKGASSLGSYPKHIKQYLQWIQGISNLKDVYFISEENYSLRKGMIEINSRAFKDLCIKG